MRFFPLSIALCLSVIGVGTQASSVSPFNESFDLNALFTEVNATQPSGVAVNELNRILQNRVACFAQNLNYAKRIKVCIEQYQEDIIHTARLNISGRPMIGLFVKNIGYCPIMHNICVGQQPAGQSQPTQACLRFERQCIELMLDRYWRGAPLYNNMQIRIE